MGSRGRTQTARRTEGSVRGRREGPVTVDGERAPRHLPPNRHVLRDRGAAPQTPGDRGACVWTTHLLRTRRRPCREGERSPVVRGPRRLNSEGDADTRVRRSRRRPEAPGHLPPRWRAGPPRRGRGAGSLRRVRIGGGERGTVDRGRKGETGGAPSTIRDPRGRPHRLLIFRSARGLMVRRDERGLAPYLKSGGSRFGIPSLIRYV